VAEPQTIISNSEEDTLSAGERFAEQLQAGDVVLLYGDLGAGKTAFVRGIARGLGASADEVTSPTFTLMQEYRGPVTLVHVDLYRLSQDEVSGLGVEESTDDPAVIAIEWAERWAGAPPDAWTVRITDEGGDRRRITIAIGELANQ
jgi:tRNA threonylcarbamoyladenosine biosynthesis protein TsaE